MINTEAYGKDKDLPITYWLTSMRKLSSRALHQQRFDESDTCAGKDFGRVSVTSPAPHARGSPVRRKLRRTDDSKVEEQDLIISTITNGLDPEQSKRCTLSESHHSFYAGYQF